jgi:adenylate cyclase
LTGLESSADADIISGRVGSEFFKDKIVLIGTSAIATYDLKNTPFSANMPGVEKNATVVANILERNFMKRADLYLDLIIIIIVGFAAIIIGREGRALHLFIYYFIIVLFIVFANQLLFTFSSTRFNLVYPLLAILSNGTFIISYRYLIEEKKAREIRRMFSSYVTERVVNELIKNPQMAKLGGERREITMLFSDIIGFTPYSEKHAPEEVVSTLNEYLAAMTDIVFRWEGTLDKFIGDAIVAFWGAPLEQKNHAELAVRCALNMIKRLGELQAEWEAKGKVPLNIGIGLNTGEVLVGNIGAEGKKMDYTVIGDQVSIGARVESLTRKFRTDILMTELPLNEIYDLVQSSKIGHVSIKGVGKVVVKGKEMPVKIYEIKSLDESENSVIEECKDEAIIQMTEK